VRSNGSYEKSVLDLIGEETSDAAGRFTQRVIWIQGVGFTVDG
jgi:hypothetical protein